jgi:hypothetical protein
MKLNSHDLDLLDKYNHFLLEHSYTDTDIELEEPTAINQFIDQFRDTTKKAVDKPRREREPDFLCTWDFCTTCIKYRKDNNIPMPKLNPHPNKVEV